MNENTLTSSKSIKIYAKIVLGVGTALSIIIAIALFSLSSKLNGYYEKDLKSILLWSGIIVLILGLLISFGIFLKFYSLGSFVGKYIDNQEDMSINTHISDELTEKIRVLNDMRKSKIISDEEFEKSYNMYMSSKYN